MRIVFMGTPDFSVPVLEQLIQSQYQVAAVYTQPDRPVGRGRASAPSAVKRVALMNGLPVFQPPRLRELVEVERLAALQPDIIIVAAFGQILPQSVLDIPNFGCLNVHPSLLPKYRGASPVAGAILAGDERTGVTIMLLDAGLDTGPIISQVAVSIEDRDTTGSLGAKLARVGARLLVDTLPLWFEHRLRPQPQDERKASYTAPLAKGDGEINWQLGATEIWRRVRAFQPWPGCYTWWQGKILKILEATPLPGNGEPVPGRVIALAPPAVVGVEAGDGVLGLSVVQLGGKRSISVSEFVRGQREFVGSVLTGKALT